MKYTRSPGRLDALTTRAAETARQASAAATSDPRPQPRIAVKQGRVSGALQPLLRPPGPLSDRRGPVGGARGRIPVGARTGPTLVVPMVGGNSPGAPAGREV